MVILRPTRKLYALLPPAPAAPGPSDTALGDWYVNRLVVDRQPLLLLVSATSLLPILVPARDVRGLPERLPGLVERRLQRYGLDGVVIGAEARVMRDVVVAPTVDRSVVGIMVDFAKAVSWYLEPGQWTDAMAAHGGGSLGGDALPRKSEGGAGGVPGPQGAGTAHTEVGYPHTDPAIFSPSSKRALNRSRSSSGRSVTWQLAAFGTRHTLSDSTSSTSGIGAAR